MSYATWVTPENLRRFTGLADATLARERALVVYQDRSDGPVLVGDARTVAEATEVVATLSFPPAVDLAYTNESLAVQAMTAALGDPHEMLRITDDAQLVFLSSVLDDATLRLVVAWEAQTQPQDGAVGIFERLS